MIGVLGIAGPYCAGKSRAAEILSSHGYRELDVDALGHEAREALADRVREEFGSDDRRYLRERVFSSPEALRRLEAILHPWMKERVAEEVRAAVGRGEKLAINAALLFPMGLQRHCELVLWIDAPVLVRFLRARRRDGAGWKEFRARIAAQSGLYPQKDAEDVDIITIQNLGSRSRLERRLAGIVQR